MELMPDQIASAEAEAGFAHDTYRKLARRLVPFLFLALMINTIDRLNIAFAKLRMADDIALSDFAYGIGVGVFYVGYIVFEIPSNLYMKRIGARRTLSRIMVLWGAITVCTALVTTSTQLMVVRFLLGIAEAGFFPGVILYLTYWFPSAVRGRVTAAYLMAGIVAGVVFGPLAGLIMTHADGLMGLHDWQVLFILTGLPAVLLGIFAWFWLTDRPADAHWLTDREKRFLREQLAADARDPGISIRFLDVIRLPRVYIAGSIYFAVYSGTNTVAYWMPTFIREFGVNALPVIGVISALPFACGLVGMYLLGRSSDKHMERRWHLALTMCFGAVCFWAIGLVQGNLPLSVTFLCLAAASAFAALPLFWTIPPALLSPGAAAGGIAIISCMGNLAGVASQATVGAIKSATGSLNLAFDIIAAVLVVGAMITLLGIPARAVSPGARSQL